MAARSAGATARQIAATRQSILEAALAQLQARPTAPFSHESVAAGAGVAPRTVYRHFPTKQDLTMGLWQRLREAHGTQWPTSERDIVPALRRTCRQFADLEPLTRAAVAAASTTGYPTHGSAEGRAAFRASLAALRGGLPSRDAERLVANCLAIYSAPYWLMLRDRGHLSATEAEAAAVSAMQALLAHATTRVADRARRRKQS
jgi:AcrR family transcriptional regulator